MDQLELLKKNWNKTAEGDKQFSSQDIYPMLLKKSSSTAKTLFYISIAELIFWIAVTIIPLFITGNYKERLNNLYEDNGLITSLSVLEILIIVVFCVLLYKSYKAISVTDSAKKLMASILKTRKIIKYYVIYNLCKVFFSFLVSFYFIYQNNDEIHTRIDTASNAEMFAIIGKAALVIGIIIGLFWLIYKLVYGLLIKRLNTNYNELKKIEG